MNRAYRALVLAATAGSLAGCDSYFTGPKLDKNPNVPSDASISQLFTSVQAIGFANQTGDIDRMLTMWMQQFAGTGRQWSLFDSDYEVDENTFFMGTFYTGGGLIDIRNMEAKANAAGDKRYLGIAQVWEALTVGTMADLWGDIPYRQAIKVDSFPEPVLDPQMQVYGDLVALLNTAITTNLPGAGSGPGPVDLVYGGNVTKWVAMARTLRARYYLHMAERDPTNYALALAEANAGISSAANDYVAYASANTGEVNHWVQFRLGRGTDIGAGKFLVDLLKTRNGGGADPRLAAYFEPGPAAPGGAIIGATPGQEDDGTIAWLNSASTGDPGYKIPLVTFAENQMIRAEATLMRGAGICTVTAVSGTNTSTCNPNNASAADILAAIGILNAYRATVGLPARPTTMTGRQTLSAIMEEKYVSLFQNWEVWNDYKRTCYPNLTPADGSVPGYIPARLYYGTDERNANSHVPAPGAQPLRNTNDPKTATDPSGAACKGQGV